MLDGQATPAAIDAYIESHSQISFRSLDETGIRVSPAGFGAYRVDIRVEGHQQALAYALRNGINLIDTSTNYADGGSEQLIGSVLQQLHDEGEVSRQAVVVVSKVGYLQGQNYEMSQERKTQGRPWPDLVTYAQGLEHCIHPEFIEDQLTRSLQRLQMKTLDVYLLHNPEYYLSWAHKNGVELQEARETYYGRIELAFRHLEEEVAQGRLQYYGISSNTFPEPATDPSHTSLARVWQIAQELTPDHHFRVIQLPMNLLETGGASEANQPGEESVLAFARRHQLGVLINRPLNAIRGERLLRLADVPVGDEPDPQEIENAVSRLVALEKRFSQEIMPLLPVQRAALAQLAEIFTVGNLLQARWRGFHTYHNWTNLQMQYIIPRVQQAVAFIRQQLQQETVQLWIEQYVDTLNESLAEVTAFYASTAARKSQTVKEQVATVDATWGEAPTLSQMAIRALRSTEGITCVLVGMRRESYVDDVLAELQRPVTLETREASWDRLAAMTFEV